MHVNCKKSPAARNLKQHLHMAALLNYDTMCLQHHATADFWLCHLPGNLKTFSLSERLVCLR